MYRLHVVVVFLAFFIPSQSKANIDIVKTTIKQGKDLCKNGQYEKGIDQILDGAMTLLKKYPSHRLNKTWRSHISYCFETWSTAELKACRKSSDLSHYENFLQIQKKSKLTASKSMKNKIFTRSTQCLNSLKVKTVKHCESSTNALIQLKKIKKYITSRDLKKFNRDFSKCEINRWKKVEKEVLGDISMKSLKKLWILWQASKSLKNRYGIILESFSRRAAQYCTDKMMYNHGRSLLLKTDSMYALDFQKDQKYSTEFSSRLNSCGIFKLRMKSQLEGKSGGINISMTAVSDFIVVPNGNNIKACGKIYFMGNKTPMGKCTIGASTSHEGYMVCMSGKIIRKKGDQKPWFKLVYDSNYARKLITEKIQKSCPGKSAVLFSEKLWENLFSNRFSVFIRAAGGESRSSRMTRDLGNGRSVSFITKWKAQYR
ncbi:MAG: hypothetical protein JXR95_08060 [Deltaproteobacteria bacterium]|nr:hypothetical protein [Deltaproteobacteria bacterium]